jgi:hypothetical protein
MRVRMRERLENPERPDKRLDGQQETMLTFVSPGVQSNLGPLTPEYRLKPRCNRYREPRRINEIANQILASNQRAGSTGLSGRAIISIRYKNAARSFRFLVTVWLPTSLKFVMIGLSFGTRGRG